MVAFLYSSASRLHSLQSGSVISPFPAASWAPVTSAFLRGEDPAGARSQRAGAVRKESIMQLMGRYWLSTVMLTAFGGLLACQLFLPGFIGIADTGDFAKVTGWLCLAPRGGQSAFTFFQSD